MTAILLLLLAQAGSTSDPDFAQSVARGDAAYLAQDREAARRHYARAETLVPPAAPAQVTRNGENAARFGAEYTYYQLYTTAEGTRTRNAAVYAFLPTKRRLCDPLPRRPDAVVLRIAVLVVRDTDLSYHEGTEVRHEARHLSDEQLARNRAAWRFGMDAIQLFSEGRVVIESDWIELEGAKVTGLQERLWKGLVPQRHLDPARILPLPEATFRQVVRDHDGVVFVWPRGEAARAFGGGPIRLPLAGGRALPPRMGILNMPDFASGCVHELLHNFDRRPGMPSVHGPRDASAFGRLGIRDEVGWYEHLVRAVPSFRALRMVDQRKRSP